jgi:MFS family permease
MNTQPGLKHNWKQFSLLVIVNGFVGAMVGLERTILPEIAESDFGIAASSAIFSFIIVFGIAKALTNYYTGVWADKIGRRKLLIVGWVLGIPVPLLLIYANDWNLIIFANILLGINQGLTWSSTVVMKIDLVGEKNRGLAMGINESAGYLAVGFVAFLTGFIAANYGLRPYPFYLGLFFVISGLILSLFFVKDTIHHVNIESATSTIKKQKNVFKETSWLNTNLGSISQAGFVNNLNDGMIWGLFPIILAAKGFDLVEIGKIVAIYPIVWGLGQLFTGKLADHFPKKSMLVIGMLMQGFSISLMAYSHSFTNFAILSIVLGVGTAVVYPTFLAAIADYSHPDQRAKSIGVFRLWRDLGYAGGAVITGIIADLVNYDFSILTIGVITVISGLLIQTTMQHNCYQTQ